MKVLFASSEIAPLAKVGGLADVSYSLPLALNKFGLDVRVIIPYYSPLIEGKYTTIQIGQPISVIMGGKTVEFELRAISDFPVKVYFIDCPVYFERSGIYSSNSGLVYNDNPERYSFFCYAIIKSLEHLGWEPDILHVNDWQSALVPALLKDAEYPNIGTLLTIHNLIFQGVIEWEAAESLGLNSLSIERERLDFYGRFNMLKAGIIAADKISTVSSGYRDETLTGGALGAGLEDVLNERVDDYTGILNGIDYDYWNPAKDEFLKVKYRGRWNQFKADNKQALLKQCGFIGANPEQPVMGIVSRLSDQKGVDLIIQTIDDLVDKGCYLVILGSGELNYETAFRNIAARNRDSVFYDSTINEPLAHLIYAGSDIFLMPSKFEPCGLSQMIAMHYGSIPVVRNVGGLRVSVREFDNSSGKGAGFKFEGYNPRAMIKAIEQALSAYREKHTWSRIISNAVREDFTWENSAKTYIEIYKQISE